MKKLFTSILMLALTLTVQAQTMNVHFKNGTKVEFNSVNVDYVDFTEKPSDPTLTPGDYVDLGLSVKWASCNLGASTPAGKGGYYAWGETSTKTEYSEKNYAYYKEGSGYTDIGENIAGTQYDAATVNLGKDWRMPTKDEVQELCDKCTFTYGEVDDVKGYYATGKNGNSIFLPCYGYKSGSNSYNWNENEGSFWTGTSEIPPYNKNNGFYLRLHDGEASINTEFKYSGLQIRPVYSPSSPGGITNITDYITINRTGMGTTISGGGTRYTVTFEISNKSTETIYLNTLAGVDISENLEGGKSYTITLQSTTAALQNYKQTLVFTYNDKKYEIKG